MDDATPEAIILLIKEKYQVDSKKVMAMYLYTYCKIVLLQAQGIYT